MNLRSSHRIGFAIIVILLSQFKAGALRNDWLPPDPQESYKLVSHETHERVLDIVFQRDEANRDYDFVLRFEPSFASESQITVKKAVGKIEVVTYRSLSGNIYKKLNSVMARGGKEDPVEMAKLIEVDRKVIEVPITQVRQWRRTLASGISASMKTLEGRSIESERGIGTVTLDGTVYSLWYDQVGSHISFRLLDQEVSNREITGQIALVRWMNAVRLDVAKRR